MKLKYAQVSYLYCHKGRKVEREVSSLWKSDIWNESAKICFGKFSCCFFLNISCGQLESNTWKQRNPERHIIVFFHKVLSIHSIVILYQSAGTISLGFLIANKSSICKFDSAEPKKSYSIETNITVESTMCEGNEAFNAISKSDGLSLSCVRKIFSHYFFHGFKGQQDYVLSFISCCSCKNLQTDKSIYEGR